MNQVLEANLDIEIDRGQGLGISLELSMERAVKISREIKIL